MKRNNKKGFTIVELVIVIAVIAILAAVLIPTFSNVIEKANKNAAMQAARNEYELYLAENAASMKGDEDFYIVSGDYYFEVVDGQFKSEAKTYAGATLTKGAFDLTKKVVKETKTTAPTADEYKDAKGLTKWTPGEAVSHDVYSQATEAEELKGFNAGVEIYAKAN